MIVQHKFIVNDIHYFQLYRGPGPGAAAPDPNFVVTKQVFDKYKEGDEFDWKDYDYYVEYQ